MGEKGSVSRAETEESDPGQVTCDLPQIRVPAATAAGPKNLQKYAKSCLTTWPDAICCSPAETADPASGWMFFSSGSWASRFYQSADRIGLCHVLKAGERW